TDEEMSEPWSLIVEAPEHWTGLDELPVDRLAAALGAGRDRLRHWSGVGGLRQGVVFKNSGAAAGASLEHVHSQLMALADVPETIAAELAGAEAWRRSQGSCAFCDLAAREIAAGDRLVLRRDGFVVLCAYAGRQPWEMWVLPERHAARYDQAADAELRPLAQVLQEAVGRLTAAAGPTAYNLILHTAPWDERHRDSYHWHWEIVPRTTHLAGFEWGAGMFINPLPPEHAAEQLRRARA
ncbi:MAG TPA: DUF4921 family protein, partial [Lacipirellulaceae bacterium]|nr:DUF4921 family protein [Lacipirellulaceae bacterium]